jgi:hypothetical protein
MVQAWMETARKPIPPLSSSVETESEKLAETYPAQ